jgi:uncharacterized protein YdaU (DUF1376 family)
MNDTLIHFPLYIGDTLKKFIDYPTLEERGAWISIVVGLIQNDGILPDDDTVFFKCLAFNDQDKQVLKQVLNKCLSKTKKGWTCEEINSLINKQKSLREKRRQAGSIGGKKSTKNKQVLKQSESESELEINKKKNKEKKDPPHQKEYDYLYKENKNPFILAGKGSRLGEDWELCDEWGDWAKNEFNLTTEKIANEAESFKEYFRSTNCPKPIKSDWLSTWRNWVRRSHG